MRDFDNRSNNDREFEEYYTNNQNADSYGSYNNNNSSYNNASFYGNYSNDSNDSYSSNNDYNNSYKNSYNSNTYTENNNNYNNNSYSPNGAYNNNHNNTFNNNYNNNAYPPNGTYNNNNYDNINRTANYEKRAKNFERVYKKQKKDSALAILVILAFFGVFGTFIFLAIMESNATSLAEQKQIEQMTTYVFFAIFSLVGFGVMVFPIINKKGKLKRCKYLVKATVTGFDRRHSSKGGSTYAPQYEFFYNGEIYNVQESSSRNFALPSRGAQVDMLINEEDPYDFYVEQKASEWFVIIIGFMFFAAGIWGLVGNLLGQI